MISRFSDAEICLSQNVCPLVTQCIKSEVPTICSRQLNSFIEAENFSEKPKIGER